MKHYVGFGCVDEGDVDLSIQGSQGSLLARGRYMWWLPQGNNTTVYLWGFAENATGTATARAVATTSLFTSMCRLGYAPAAAAGSSAGTRHGLLQFWRGNAAGLGGFFYLARFGIAQFQTNLRAFVGLYGTATAIGNVNPSTLLNMVGLAVDSGQCETEYVLGAGLGGEVRTRACGASTPLACRPRRRPSCRPTIGGWPESSQPPPSGTGKRTRLCGRDQPDIPYRRYRGDRAAPSAFVTRRASPYDAKSVDARTLGAIVALP